MRPHGMFCVHRRTRTLRRLLFLLDAHVSTIPRMQDHGAIANVVGPEPHERPHCASLPTTEHCVRALHEVLAPTAMAVRARISGLGSSTLSKDGSWSRRFTLLAGIQTVADCLPRPRLWLAMTSGRLARCLDKWSRMPPPFGNAVPFEGGIGARGL